MVVKDTVYPYGLRELRVKSPRRSFVAWVDAGSFQWEIAYGEPGMPDLLVKLPAVDLAPHRAFCAGTMPACVYADWLEENGVELPAEAYAILRM